MPPTATKQTKKAPAKKQVKETETKEAKAAARDGDVFKFVKDPEKKQAPQAQIILNAVKAAGKKGITRGNLLKIMEKEVTTRQPIARILSYYQGPLVKEHEAIVIEKAS
jgi:GTPase Era involved in 16S rRNA processing